MVYAGAYGNQSTTFHHCSSRIREAPHCGSSDEKQTLAQGRDRIYYRGISFGRRAKVKISTVGLSREDWLKERRLGIGASDAPTIVGLGYDTPYDLYLEKRGEAEPKDLSDNEAVHFGQVLEEIVAQEFARRNNRKVRRVNAILQHPEHPFMRANLDREIVAEPGGEPEILECKTTGYRGGAAQWGESGDEVPDRVIVQVQHQLSVRRRTVAYVAVLIGGQQYRQYRIVRDEPLIEMLIAAETRFWECVETGTPPEIQSIVDAKKRYPVSRDVVIEASPEVNLAVFEMRSLQEQIDALQAAYDAAKTLVLSCMGDADTLTFLGAKLATWKSSRAFDEGVFLDRYPDLAAACTKTVLDTSALKKANKGAYEDCLLPASRRFLIAKG